MNNRFLKNGLQTKITRKIKQISDDIEGNELRYVKEVIMWLHNNLPFRKDKVLKQELFRRRTADQIITDGFVTGCTDITLVFISLVRAKGIPAKYVEAVSERWIKTGNKKLKGHVFAECLINDRWVKVDPTNKSILKTDNYPNFVVYKKGLDSWDLRIRSFQDLEKAFYSLK